MIEGLNILILPLGAATMSSQNQFQGPGQTRAHKHIDLMSLTAIRRVVDLIDGEDCNDCFTLVCRTNQVRLTISFSLKKKSSLIFLSAINMGNWEVCSS